MIDKKMIKQMLRSIVRKRDGLGDHRIMHPIRDWFIGWLIALVLLAGFGFWWTTLYWKYTGVETTDSFSNNAPLTIYRENEVKQAINQLDLKKAAYTKNKEKLLQSRYVTPPVEVSEPLVERETDPTPESEESVSPESVPLDPDINNSSIR